MKIMNRVNLALVKQKPCLMTLLECPGHIQQTEGSL